LYYLLIIAGLLVCVGAIIVTFSVGRDVDSTIKKRESEGGDKVYHEFQRSRSYEQSFTNVRWLLLIYSLVFLIAILLLVLFVFVF
jgi:hypothetical protein